MPKIFIPQKNDFILRLLELRFADDDTIHQSHS